MKTEQIMKLASGFEDTLVHYRTGEVTVPQLHEMLAHSLTQIKMSVDFVIDVIDGNKPDEMSLVEEAAILASLESEVKDFDLVQYKKDLDIVFNLAETADQELGEPVFKPFMEEIVKSTITLSSKFNSELTDFTVKYFKEQ